MSYRIAISFFFGIVLSVCVGALLPLFPYADAQSVDDLKQQIADRNERLKSIEKEIAEYEAALKEVGAERSTLEKAIRGLELERGKINADIRYTENLIGNTDMEIDKLSLEIRKTQLDINQNMSAIGETLRALQTTDDITLLEALLRYENISEFWGYIADLSTVRTSMGDQVTLLSGLQEELQDRKFEETGKREDLVSLKEQYAGQQAILSANKAEKDELLQSTKSEEAAYQDQLKSKQAAKDALLKEVANIESQLKFILDPNKIPTAGSAVFRWPLDSVYITQYFGYTKFALGGAYGGSKHNGVDFGTPTGSRLYAPLSGTIRATGNTDLVAGCYSWGKWILVDHPNGLSSMFAHLSNVQVSAGQQVSTGDVIGFTGNTGYSTGPHLHYTLYVSDAVQVKGFNEFKSVTSCGSAASPFSAIEGYLNPLDYLPAI